MAGDGAECRLDLIRLCLDAGQEGLLTEKQFHDLAAELLPGRPTLVAAVRVLVEHCEALVELAAPLRAQLQDALPAVNLPEGAAAGGGAPSAAGAPATPMATPRKRAFGRPTGAPPKTPFRTAGAAPSTPMRTPFKAPAAPFRTPFKTPRSRKQPKTAGRAEAAVDGAEPPRLRRKPTILIVGKGVQNIPFECMPALWHLPVTRLPCLPFALQGARSQPDVSGWAGTIHRRRCARAWGAGHHGFAVGLASSP